MPSVVDVTVVTPYESQVTLKVCAPPAGLLPHLFSAHVKPLEIFLKRTGIGQQRGQKRET